MGMKSPPLELLRGLTKRVGTKPFAYWFAFGKRRDAARIILVLLTIALIALAHWWTPTTRDWLHAVHVLMRKSFLVPILLAAVWYNLRGALLAALVVSFVYLPHVFFQWGGNLQENVNQIGELVTVWGSALLAGWLVEKEKRALRHLARTHEGALVALVKALDAREHDTRDHSLRVRAFAERIAAEYGMAGENREELARGALLHDIGKIGIPDSVLLKKGPLTSGERQIMRKHPEIGRRILESVPSTEQAALIVHCHHEKYDGTGYPRGLRGDDIPLGARVFAVADVFDALTSDRPYHKAVTIAEAVERIRRDTVSHFDPEVVTAFLRIPEEEWSQVAENLEANCRARDGMSSRVGISPALSSLKEHSYQALSQEPAAVSLTGPVTPPASCPAPSRPNAPRPPPWRRQSGGGN